MRLPATIAHLTDVHLGPIASFTPRYWNLKRGLGYANWARNRKNAYRQDVLDRMVADIGRQNPDHLVVTGDLANLGLPGELDHARAWLDTLGSPKDVTVIPGNHDIYSRLGADGGIARWQPYMCCDTQGQVHAGEPSGDGFPFVRMLGPIALIGLNSAIHTPPLIAWGRLGAAQLQRLAQVLRRIGDAGCFRLVLIHHPPLPGQATPTRGLRDAKELRTLLEAHGAELAVHGHNHTSTLVFCAGPNGPIPVVGAPSGSLGRSRKNEPLARYHLYRIGGPPWSAEMISRGLTEEEGDIVEIDRRQLLPSAVA